VSEGRLPQATEEGGGRGEAPPSHGGGRRREGRQETPLEIPLEGGGRREEGGVREGGKRIPLHTF
jgi:hypothetical protein